MKGPVNEEEKPLSALKEHATAEARTVPARASAPGAILLPMNCAALDLLRSLVRHQVWADNSLLQAVQAHPESLGDQALYKVLHHIVMVQRAFLSFFHDRTFDRAKESQPPESFDQLVQLFRDTHKEELAFVNGLTESELDRRFDLPFFKSHPTVAEGLTQVVMHSQNHRGQCLTRIRENGGKPPTLDYIKWAKDQHPDRGHST